MTELDPAAEIERLHGRVRRLAEEKSYLQLTLRMIEQITPMTGVHEMVAGMLQGIVETIGGTNSKIWYWIDNQLLFADFLGAQTTVDEIDDPLAQQVAKERRFIEQFGDVDNALLRGGVLPGSWTWVFPLLVGKELIGIVKLENLHITGASLRTYLPTFFNHAALLLSNEIRNHLIQEHQSELERIAHYDTLTGIPNRRLLADRLNQELARTRRSGRTLAICYLDLDGFKPVNDQFGHDAGDLLLIEISQRLLAVSRAGDTVARLGGDEFVMLYSDLTQEQECFQALERVLASVARPFEINHQHVTVSASIGVTLFPRDNVDADTLLRHADQAMYQAKDAGKGRFHLFDAEHDRLVKANRSTIERLRLALANGEFLLHYQPKVDMVRGEVRGAEALIRWQHPVRGMLSPAEFLPLLSGTELEIAVGEWVIDTALGQIETWKAGGLKLSISVNISARHLLRPHFMEQLEQALARHPDVGAGDLELEILESTAIDDLSNAARTLAGCIAMGVRFALDDFGTGYSSLTYFRKLPIGTLKIDQSFVRGMLDDPEDLGIIESVVGLAKAFNRPVIAEGVETIEHGAMLVRMGCHLGQGYGIARPMPADALPAWVSQWSGEEIWRTLGRYDLPHDDMVLMVAITSHRNWYMQLEAYLDNPANVERQLPVLHPMQCPFGRWYHGSGISRYGHLSEFVELDTLHNEVHALGETLIQLRQSGDARTAQARLPETQALQQRIIACLDSLITRAMQPPEARMP